MDVEEREPATWGAIGMRDAADRILEQLARPEPDWGEVLRQAHRAARCTAEVADAAEAAREEGR